MVGTERQWPAFYYCSSQLPVKTQTSLKTIPSIRKEEGGGRRRERKRRRKGKLL